jgi:hypothetical protein
MVQLFNGRSSGVMAGRAVVYPPGRLARPAAAGLATDTRRFAGRALVIFSASPDGTIPPTLGGPGAFPALQTTA